ncbi:MAG: hypothetical protein OXG69_06785 [bacterium]|nr:hypothetical protein [bacterium]
MTAVRRLRRVPAGLALVAAVRRLRRVPAGLALVAAARRPRAAPSGRAGRRTARALAGAALVLAGVLAPVGVGPESLGGPGDAAVLAQNVNPPDAIVRGNLVNSCPSGYTVRDTNGNRRIDPDDRECEQEVDACPRSPVTQLHMEASVSDTGNPRQWDYHGTAIRRYPHFCEERILEESEPNAYKDCAARTGYVVMIHEMEVRYNAGDPVLDGDGNPVLDGNGDAVIRNDPVYWRMCRLLTTPRCPPGLNRVDSASCKVVTRRTWTCRTGYLPRNEFNRCYQPPPTRPAGASHPACGPGAPDLVAADCEEYVGDDYALDPAQQLCGEYKTGKGRTKLKDNTLSGSSAAYWCEFRLSHLKAVCQGPGNPRPGECAPTVARCLKRATAAGGCHTVAATIRCEKLQADYASASDRADRVEKDAAANDAAKEAAKKAKGDAADNARKHGCEPVAECVVLPFASGSGPSDPSDCLGFHGPAPSPDNSFDYLQPGACSAGVPAGRLTWKSGHESGLVIVGAPVVLRVEDVPSQLAPRHRAIVRERVNIYGHRSVYRVEIETKQYLRYGDRDDDPGDDPHGDDLFIRVWPEMDPSRQYGEVREVMELGRGRECLIEGRPRFKVTIRELRADVVADRTTMRNLFGDGPADRWDEWWADLSPAEQQHYESVSPSAALSEEVDCHSGEDYWCRWEPPRPGYFAAVADGTWRMEEMSLFRAWPPKGFSDPRAQPLLTYLQSPDPDNVAELHSKGLKWAHLGLQQAQNNPYIWTQAYTDRDNEWLYTEDAGQQYRCPATDLRIAKCNVRRTVRADSHSPPIGIEVHEIRVGSRTSNR